LEEIAKDCVSSKPSVSQFLAVGALVQVRYHYGFSFWAGFKASCVTLETNAGSVHQRADLGPPFARSGRFVNTELFGIWLFVPEPCACDC
jgi:hypothetical protein